MIRRTRRTVLYGLGGGSVAALAGCTTEGDPGSGDGTDGSDGGDVGDGSDGAPETEVQQVGAALSGPAWDRESRRGFCTLFTDEDEIRWLFDDASAEVGEFVEATDFSSSVPCSRTSNRSGRRPATVRSPSPTSASRTGRSSPARPSRAPPRTTSSAARRSPTRPRCSGYRRPAAGFAPAVGNERLGRDRGADRRRRHPRPLTRSTGSVGPTAPRTVPAARRSTARTTPSSAIPPPTRGRIVGIRRPRRR